MMVPGRFLYCNTDCDEQGKIKWKYKNDDSYGWFIKELENEANLENIELWFTRERVGRVNPHRPNMIAKKILQRLTNHNKCKGYYETDYDKGFYNCFEDRHYEPEYIFWKCCMCRNGLNRKLIMDDRRTYWRIADISDRKKETNGNGKRRKSLK